MDVRRGKEPVFGGMVLRRVHSRLLLAVVSREGRLHLLPNCLSEGRHFVPAAGGGERTEEEQPARCKPGYPGKDSSLFCRKVQIGLHLIF